MEQRLHRVFDELDTVRNKLDILRELYASLTAERDALLARYAEAEKERDIARRELREIASVCDTLSPQEFLNHAAVGCDDLRKAYTGEADPNLSIIELMGQRDRAHERGVHDVRIIRCMAHYGVPQQNNNEASSGECGGCIAAERDALREQVKTLREALEQVADNRRCACNGGPCHRCEVAYDEADNALAATEDR
jgi:predicted nuclease with TOPRIM domain